MAQQNLKPLFTITYRYTCKPFNGFAVPHKQLLHWLHGSRLSTEHCKGIDIAWLESTYQLILKRMRQMLDFYMTETTVSDCVSCKKIYDYIITKIIDAMHRIIVEKCFNRPLIE